MHFDRREPHRPVTAPDSLAPLPGQRPLLLVARPLLPVLVSSPDRPLGHHAPFGILPRRKHSGQSKTYQRWHLRQWMSPVNLGVRRSLAVPGFLDGFPLHLTAGWSSFRNLGVRRSLAALGFLDGFPLRRPLWSAAKHPRSCFFACLSGEAPLPCLAPWTLACRSSSPTARGIGGSLRPFARPAQEEKLPVVETLLTDQAHRGIPERVLTATASRRNRTAPAQGARGTGKVRQSHVRAAEGVLLHSYPLSAWHPWQGMA